MASGRLDSEPSSEGVVSPYRPAETRAESGATPFRRLAASTRPLAAAALAGGLVAAGVTLVKRPRYRAVARVLVVEPRLGSGPTVDFNLTPIRSYASLLTSPSLLARCAEGGETLASSLRVRVPENTRILEVSYVDPTAMRSAAVVNCAVARAIEENRRVNAELAARSGATVEEALARSSGSIAVLEAQLARTRLGVNLQLEKQELASALSDLAKSAEEERAARVRLAEAAARKKSFGETVALRPERRRFETFLGEDARTSAAAEPAPARLSSPVVREESDPTRERAQLGMAEAAADDAAARSAAAAAVSSRSRAEARAATLEQRIAAQEDTLSALGHRVDAASAARNELEKRRASATLEAAAKAFELVPLSPAVPPARPDGVPPVAAGAAGAVSALLVGILFVLSRAG
jgi:uncharacterized coiled-coil protein SlyX